MDFVTAGLTLSTLFLSLLVVLLAYERSREVRFFNGLRTSLDFIVLKCAYFMHTTSKRIGGHLIRQIFHYLFHTCIGLVLALIRRCDQGLRNVMHVNKTLAKTAAKESLTRSKLEEIALHKAASALTEDEKRAHKDKMLNG